MLQTTPNSGMPVGSKIATDPPVSERQRRAMYAALSGHSTIGIPKSVAEKFVGKAHDMSEQDWAGLYNGLRKFFSEERQEDEHAQDDPSRGAGVALRNPAGEMLLVKRAKGDESGTWAFPGGYAQQDESEEAAAIRELEEELGYLLREPLQVQFADAMDAFKYTTFLHDVADRFEPQLDHENSEYVWAKPDNLPQPLHPGVARMFGRDDFRMKVALKMPDVTEKLAPTRKNGTAPEGKALDDVGDVGEKVAKETVDYSLGKGADLCKNCTHFLKPDSCERVMGRIEPEYWCNKFVQDPAGMAADSLVFDRASARTFDADQRLHVATNNISKANVCPYLGREIPDAAKLGLDQDKFYYLLRDPLELSKAAPTFNNLPVLNRHVPVSASDHQPELVIGSTGTDAEFKFPYLRNSLVIWAKDAIDAIESEVKKELSCAYRYRADMTPGTFQGIHYDGVMRDIVGNHVALVKEGRAGGDVVVGDAKPQLQHEETITMQTLSRKAALVEGGLMAFLIPKLAQDAKLPDLTSILKDVNGTNYADMKPKILEGITSVMKDVKLAQDAKIDGIKPLLDAYDKVSFASDADPDDEEEKKAADAEEDDEEKKKKAQDRGKRRAHDEPPPFKGKPEAEDEEDDDKKDKAMDEAIKMAVDSATKRAVAEQHAVREAERKVRPWVGELAHAFDSVAGVYRAALTALGMDGVDKIHEAALPYILEAQPKPGARKQETTTVAQDAATVDSFNKRFPNANRISVLG